MRKPKIFFRTAWLTAVVAPVLLASLVACSSADNSTSATSAFNAKARKATHRPAQTKSGEEDLADMVNAVSATKTGFPVELKFALTQKPELGQVLDLHVAVVPGVPAPENLSVSFQVPDGLDIVDGAELPTVEKPVEGTPLRHTVKVMPKRDGIFAVTAVVSVGPTNQTTTRTFSIPVIAGEGLAELVTKPEVAKGL
jgi:hypothetical protein